VGHTTLAGCGQHLPFLRCRVLFWLEQRSVAKTGSGHTRFRRAAIATKACTACVCLYRLQAPPITDEMAGRGDYYNFFVGIVFALASGIVVGNGASSGAENFLFAPL
jgi:hypothetical protein